MARTNRGVYKERAALLKRCLITVVSIAFAVGGLAIVRYQAAAWQPDTTQEEQLPPLPDSLLRYASARVEAIQPICVKEKVLPNVFLLGAQKAGTTEMYHVLEPSGIRNMMHFAIHNWQPPQAKKEWHVFDTGMGMETWSMQEVAKHWYSMLPSCLGQTLAPLPDYKGHDAPINLSADVRLADYTPRNLCLTDVDDLQVDGPSSIDLPYTLHYLYGVEAARIRFMVQLREPLSRMQSSFYMLKRNTPRLVDRPTFREQLRFVLNLLDEGTVHRYLWRSLYGRHLEGWFTYFHPGQFSIVPYRYLNDKYYDTDVVCRDLSSHLQHQLKCELFKRPNKGGQRHLYPAVDEDVPVYLLSRARSGLANETARLEAVLIFAQDHGATMPHLDRDAPHLLAEVRAWLQEGW
mmetsp:Transcript_18719/g.33866  ORF Transcript_18719/g.33866 Transcript_18719/m.33866 type:complete len:405 (+) Transcript_18719:63-1277(+)